jgi:hypothetical protein
VLVILCNLRFQVNRTLQNFKPEVLVGICSIGQETALEALTDSELFSAQLCSIYNPVIFQQIYLLGTNASNASHGLMPAAGDLSLSATTMEWCRWSVFGELLIELRSIM